MNKELLCLLLMIWISHLLVAQTSEVTSRLETFNIETGERTIIYEEDTHFEAPNWSPDGTFFVINSGGRLYRVPAKGGTKEIIETGSADNCNNDHGISPDGQQLAFSHYDDPDGSYEDYRFETSRIYTIPITGGVPTEVTSETPSFWHAWSPDGQTMLYTALRDDNFDIYAIPAAGGKEQRLTDAPGLDDGSDFLPDGEYIYFNSMRSGRMEIWRMQANGSQPEQLTDDAYSNWFPHPSPNGKYFVFLSYLQDQGDAHPALKPVALRLYDLATGDIRELTQLTGGQGTINVPSWSPDGQQFAFVAYETR